MNDQMFTVVLKSREVWTEKPENCGGNFHHLVTKMLATFTRTHNSRFVEKAVNISFCKASIRLPKPTLENSSFLLIMNWKQIY